MIIIKHYKYMKCTNNPLHVQYAILNMLMYMHDSYCLSQTYITNHKQDTGAHKEECPLHLLSLFPSQTSHSFTSHSSPCAK